MSKTVVVYHSGYGHTQRVAQFVAEGAKAQLIAIDAEGNLSEADWTAINAADAIIFGTPTYMGGVSAPFKTFMLAQTRDKDLIQFFDIAKIPVPEDRSAAPIQIVVPAFIISELRRAFEIGFLLFVPFLVIDLVVASILMGMGMMMLPPITISLPFKLIFFVLVDGWSLVAGSLVQSFGSG